MEVIFNLQDQYFKKDQKSFTYKDKSGNEQELSINILNRILSLIANAYLYNQDENAEFTEISSIKFKNIDNNYKSYQAWLISNFIIIPDNHYQVADEAKGIEGECKKYAFTDEFKDWGRVTKIRKDKFDENTNRDQYTLITIDADIIRKIRKDFKAIQLRDLPIEKKPKIDTPDMSIINFKSYLASELSFWRMKNNDTYYNWKSGRLYTNFCQCSKSTRLNNFYFEDKLANLDIPSSFPLWLAVWLKDHGADTESYEYCELCTLVKPILDGHGNFIRKDNGKLITSFYNDLREKLDNNRDVILSQKVQPPITRCQVIENKNSFDHDGFIIETTRKKCLQKLDEEGYCPVHGYPDENNPSSTMRYERPHISKDKAKELFQQWLNGDNGAINLVNYIFKCYYGDIQSMVDQHKNGDKKFMYYQLVKMETNFIFNVICSRLYSEIPSIQILTCHDEIYFEEKYLEQVEIIWNEELMKIYDQLPSHDELDIDYEAAGIRASDI